MSKRLSWLLGAAAVILPSLALAQTTSDVFTSTSSADAGATALGFGFLFFIFVAGIISLALWILWLFMLVDIVHRDFTNPGDKTVWVLVLGILSGLGAIIYYFFGRPHGTRPNHDHSGNSPMPPVQPPHPPMAPPSAPSAPEA